MRHDAPFLVKRYAPIIGRPDGPRRVAVEHQAYTLEAALEWARSCWHAGQPLGPRWIERRGQPAVVKR